MNIRENEGITLIALIITIIIMIILAAVTISIVMNGGLFNQADKASIEWRGASVEEVRDLWFADKKADEMSGNSAQSLREVLDELVSKKLLTEEERDHILDPDNLAKTVEIGSRSGDNAISFKYGIIGDYVNYYPDIETFNLTAIPTDGNETYKTYSGYSSNTGTISTEDLTWRILDIVNGQIVLICDEPTISSVGLSGENGYNNGVKLLDEICKKLYSSDKGVARSLKIEDIEKTMTSEDLESKYTLASNQFETSTWSNAKRQYPTIWEDEKGNIVDENPTNGRLGQSEQNIWYNGTTKPAVSLTYHWNAWKSEWTVPEYKDEVYRSMLEYVRADDAKWRNMDWNALYAYRW